METSMTQNGETGVLRLCGDLTIQNAVKLLEVLKEIGGQHQSIEIQLAKDVVIDCSTLQLFCSLHRTAAANNQSISLAAEEPTYLSGYATRIGYRRGKGCVFSNGRPCLWGEGVAYE